MPLKLYKLDMSPPVCGTLMVIDLLKVPIELVDVNLLKGDHLKPEYLEKNPLHTIPMLEDGGLYIHESHVIMTYLTEMYSKDDSLYPKDPKKRALVDQKLYFDGLFFTRFKNISYPAIFESVRKPSEKAKNDITECYDVLETFLSKSKFVAGDVMTIADISLLSTFAVARHIVPYDARKYPKVAAWLFYMEQQPFYKKHGEPGSLALIEFLKDILDF